LGELPSDHELIRRFRIHEATPIGEALMNQTIVCGVGNVYKSEVLFICRVNPFTLVGELSDDQLLRLLQRARKLMRRNLEGYPRRTRFASDGRRQWVYGRRNDPCLVCGGRIQMRRQGDLGRSTFWCPTCQRED
jgi:endonuclease-8